MNKRLTHYPRPKQWLPYVLAATPLLYMELGLGYDLRARTAAAMVCLPFVLALPARSGEPAEQHPRDVWGLAYLAAVTVGLLLAHSIREAFVDWMLAGFGVILVTVLPRKAINTKRWVRILLYGALVVAVLGLVEYAVMGLPLEPGEIFRVKSLLLNPNYLSGLLAALIPLAVALRYQGGIHGVFWTSVTLVLVAAQVLTYTRGGWIAVLLALVFFAVRHDRGLLKIITVLVVVFVLVTPGVLPRAESIVRDVPSGDDTSSMGRVQLWIVGAHLFSEQPLAGVGTGDYAHMHDLTVDNYPQWDAGLRGRGPHNSYVKIAAENGLLGLVPFLVLVSFIWHESSMAVRRSSSPERRALLIGFQSSVLAVLVHAGTNSVLHIESTAPLLWLVLALVCAAASEENPQPELQRHGLNSRSS